VANTRGSDNPFPSILVVEGTEPTAPSAGSQRLYIDSTTHKLKRTDSSGTDVTIEASAGLSDPMTTRGDIIVRNASNVTARLAIGSTGKVLSSNGTDISWQTPSGGSGSLSYLQSFLSADVMFAAANTFYDGPTVTLSAGTWWLSGRLMLLDPTGGSGIYSLKLWDGTTVATNYQISGPGTGSWLAPPPLSAVVVVASGTPVWKVSAAWQGGAGANLIKAAGNTNISGNVASVMTAIKIA
jgi:hypothetical protein